MELKCEHCGEWVQLRKANSHVCQPTDARVPIVLPQPMQEQLNNEILNKAMSENAAIRHKIKSFRSSHLNRLSSEQTSPLMSLGYMDLLNSYRRMLDHALNIAEVLCGEK